MSETETATLDKPWPLPAEATAVVSTATVDPGDAQAAVDKGPYALLLGLAQDGGYPQAGCRGACCAPAWADTGRRRLVAGLAVVDPAGPRRWLIDATPDLCAQLRLLDQACPPPPDQAAPALEGVVLTHAHLGHVLGLPLFGKEVMGAHGLPVYAMPRLRAFLRRHEPWAGLEREGFVRYAALEADRPLSLAPGLSVTPIAVPHRAEHSETVAFRVRGPRGALLYLPDLDGWPQAEAAGLSLASLLAPVDRAYLDATFYSAAELPGRDLASIPHPLVVQTLERAAALPPAERAKLRLIHLNHSNPLLQADAPEHRALEALGVRLGVEGERLAL